MERNGGKSLLLTRGGPVRWHLPPPSDGRQDVDVVTDGAELGVELLHELGEVSLATPQPWRTELRTLDVDCHQSRSVESSHNDQKILRVTVGDSCRSFALIDC